MTFAQATINPPGDFTSLANKPFVTCGDVGYEDLETILTAVPANLTIVVADEQTLTDDATVPATCTLVIINPGFINIPAAKTLTITGKFEGWDGACFVCADNGIIIPAPNTPSVVESGVAGVVTAGIHYIKASYVTATGETRVSPWSIALTADGSHKIDVSNISISTDADVTGRNIYMNKANTGTTTGVFYKVSAGAGATIDNNVDTTYTINIADADLDDNTAAPSVDTTYYSPVKFELGSCSEINVLWFGADPSGTLSSVGAWVHEPNDSADAIQNAIYSDYVPYATWGTFRTAPVPKIKIPRGTYAISHRILHYYWLELYGDGEKATWLVPTAAFPESRLAKGFGLIWCGYDMWDGNSGQKRRAEWVHDIGFDFSGYDKDKRITGIWGYGNCRRSYIHNIYGKGNFLAMPGAAPYGAYNKFTLIHLQKGNSSESGEFTGTKVVDEDTLVVGDDTAGPYSFTLSHIDGDKPYGDGYITKGSVVVSAGAQTVYDDREFGFYDGIRGIINYDTGDVTVTFGAVVAAATPITVTYFYNTYHNNHNTMLLADVDSVYLSSENYPIFVEANSDAEGQIVTNVSGDASRGVMNYGGYQCVINDISTEPTYIQPWKTQPYVGEYTELTVAIDAVANTLTRSAGSWPASTSTLNGIITLSGCTTATNDGQYKILARTSNTVLTYDPALCSGTPFTEAGTGAQVARIWSAGGKNPQIKQTAGNTVNYHNAYWDGGYGHVCVWVDVAGGYTGTFGYEWSKFTGYQAGLAGPGEWFQMTYSHLLDLICTRIDDTSIRIYDRTFAECHIYANNPTPIYIWIETAAGERYKYHVTTPVTNDGDDCIVTVSLTDFLPTGTIPPPIPVDATRVWTCVWNPNWYTINAQTSKLQILSVGQLTGWVGWDGVYDNGNSSTAATINWNNGNLQRITTTGNCTLTFTAPDRTGYQTTYPNTGIITLKLIHEASATAYAYTWPSTVKWVGGTKPVTTNTSGAVDVVSFLFDGTNYYEVSRSLDLRNT